MFFQVGSVIISSFSNSISISATISPPLPIPLPFSSSSLRSIRSSSLLSRNNISANGELLCSNDHLLLISNRDGIDLLVLVRIFDGGVDAVAVTDRDGGDGGEEVGFHVVDASKEDDLFISSLVSFLLSLTILLFSTA